MSVVTVADCTFDGFLTRKDRLLGADEDGEMEDAEGGEDSITCFAARALETNPDDVFRCFHNGSSSLSTSPLVSSTLMSFLVVAGWCACWSCWCCC